MRRNKYKLVHQKNMNIMDTIKERYHQQQSKNGASVFTSIEKNAFEAFTKIGIPTVKNEEWKYTRISGLFNKDFSFANPVSITNNELNAVRLPGYENATELVFVNGVYTVSLSTIRSEDLIVQSLEEAANGKFNKIVTENLGHSSKYIKDGIHALNTAFLQDGIFIHVKKGKIIDKPVYIYHLIDARSRNILSQPRILIHVDEHADVEFVANYATIGASESLTNEVTEVIVEQGAVVEYYKIQNDVSNSSQINTTHFRQIGKSHVHTVCITLNGGIVRNNLNIALEASHSEANLHGLYFQRGQTHVDNHTLVDNVQPNCLSNELYKGIVDDTATAVFNGKIFVRQDAQKTNAFQSNKNILLSYNASVNTKPQLEIFADDVKCSHGCTIGQLDDEALFYLRSRGISERAAKSLLVHAFALDILEHIKSEPVRNYVDGLISERLEVELK